jgi:regulator of chromosome condensation
MISAGDNHTAALTRDGRVFTWGTYKDSNGYIGYAPGIDKAAEPRQVLAGVSVRGKTARGV